MYIRGSTKKDYLKTTLKVNPTIKNNLEHIMTKTTIPILLEKAGSKMLLTYGLEKDNLAIEKFTFWLFPTPKRSSTRYTVFAEIDKFNRGFGSYHAEYLKS